ncbi:hypothetical protein CFP56_004011, partial [Quercus suber]
MDSKNAAEETMPSSLSSLISLAFASASSSSAQQPYFSELLSFNLDCLQKGWKDTSSIFDEIGLALVCSARILSPEISICVNHSCIRVLAVWWK